MSETAPLNQPRSKTDLFVSFTLLALQGFGGVLAVVQRELVEKKRWMTREQFVEDWAVAQIMPGPNVVNLSLMIGGRYFGWRGALAAGCRRARSCRCCPWASIATISRPIRRRGRGGSSPSACGMRTRGRYKSSGFNVRATTVSAGSAAASVASLAGSLARPKPRFRPTRASP